MAMTGGIGYEIDQLTELGVPELMRRQGVDPQLKYALALQQATKMVEAAARERDMSQPMPAPANVVGQMETSLAKRLAPGVQMQGQRSQRMQNRAAMGLPGQAAPNLARMAQGGIVGYAEGGDVQQQDPMQAQLERFMQLQKLYETRQAAGATEEELTRIQEDIDSYSRVNSPGYNIETEAAKARGEYNTPNGMAMGGIVGYEKGGPVDMDALLDALMIAESGGDPKAVSRAGAEGAYQIMPSTAADPGFGVSPMEGDRFDPEASRAFARQYLQAMLDRYDGDVEAALIAYNAGAGNADKFMAANRDYDVLPQTMQTKPYVSKIMGQVEQEDRRRDFQMGGGRTISTTAPESYTERQRRETKERADRALASRFATVPEETKSELYEPNIPDALAVAKAQTDLMGGPTMNMGERDPRFSDPANYLRDMGAKQTADNKERFAQAFPKAEKAVADYAEDKKLGGLGALRTMGRLQENRRNAFSEAFPKAAQAAAEYATDKGMGGIGALRVAGRLQEQREANEKAEANRALNYLKQQAEMQQLLEAIDPAAQDVKGFDQGGGVESEEEVSPGLLASRQTAGNIANFFTGLTEGQQKAQQRKEGFNRIVQAGNEAIARGENPEQVRAARAAARKEVETEAALEVAAGMDKPTVPTRQEAFADMFPNAQSVAERFKVQKQLGTEEYPEGAPLKDAPKKGLAGLLSRIDMGKVANVVETLGRGAGASKGFEAAQIVQESAKARAIQQARQDQLDKLSQQLDVEREKIGATKSVAESRALAALNKEQREAVSKFIEQNRVQLMDIQEQIGAESMFDPRVLEAIRPELEAYLSAIGMAGSVGNMPGLPEGVTVKRVN